MNNSREAEEDNEQKETVSETKVKVDNKGKNIFNHSNTSNIRWNKTAAARLSMV